MSRSDDTKAVPKHLASIPLLDRLRPPPGWRTDRAVLATYSAEAAVIVAALLALGGRDDDQGSGSRLDLARSLTRLRHRVHFVVQAGRLGLTRNPLPILALLDRFIVQMPWDEGDRDAWRGRSWHPKFALSRQVSSDGKSVRWVFVLGSRNLTRDSSWDLCLALESNLDRNRHSQTVPGIANVAYTVGSLLTILAPWTELAGELADVQWKIEPGLHLAQLRLMMPGDGNRALPMPPKGTNRLLAVAPFLDGTTVRTLSTWCDDGRLLSTNESLAKLADQASRPLRNWKVVLELPEPEYIAAEEAPSVREADDQAADAQNRGLHAKFLLAEHGAMSTLWLGSPNLTDRAWTRNAEIFAEMRVDPAAGAAAKALIEGIWRFADSAREVSLSALDLVEPANDDERLEEARRQVAARLRNARQWWQRSPATIECDPAPHPDDAEVQMSVARVTGPFVAWPRGATRCALPDAGPDSVVSELIRVQLSCGEGRIAWVHALAVSPELQEERDERALRQYLGARQTLAWIRDVLSDVPGGDGGGSWDAPTRPMDQRGGGSRLTGEPLPSIESALRAWLRSPEPFDEVDRILRMKIEAAQEADDLEEQSAAAHLAKFAKAWAVLRKSLPGSSRHGG